MTELTADNVVDYLRARGLLPADERAAAEALAWGVSNVVLRVRRPEADDLVVKQSREKLRTQADWFSRLDRVYREADTMRLLAPLLPEGAVPRVLDEDREQYAFVMEALPADHRVWKAELLAGEADTRVAREAARMLAAIHELTRDDATARERLADREVFHQLRIDPFYVRIAETHPAIRGAIGELVDETSATAACVVHADFSPKNLLLTRRGLSLVDYETAHYGDPAFDLGFYFSHLLLKTVRQFPDEERGGRFLELARESWRAYGSTPGDRDASPAEACERRAVRHLAACMLARVDGKSTVDYLDGAQQDFVRSFCFELFDTSPQRIEEVFDRLAAGSRCRGNAT